MGLSEVGREYDIFSIAKKPEEERTEEENIALAAYGLEKQLKAVSNSKPLSLVRLYMLKIPAPVFGFKKFTHK